MKLVPTTLPGVLIIEPAVFRDERGWFSESWNEPRFNAALADIGLPLPRHFVQDNHSCSQAGVLRGLHYQLPPHAQGKLVRVVKGAAYDFGAKFGATPALAVDLLQRVARAGLTPALTFHVGTQCPTPAPWAAYLTHAAQIAQAADVHLHRLNVGGGFPSARNGIEPDYDSFFRVIRAALELFDTAPALVCEPGRGLVADAFAYAVQVKSIRAVSGGAGRVYLNDGIYGGLSEFPSMGLPEFRVIGLQGQIKAGPMQAAIVYGPTCDSLDQLPGNIPLPMSLEPGDWLLFRAMGAYMFGVTTRFNGYGTWDNVAVSTL